MANSFRQSGSTDLGNYLRKHREELGISQRQLAERTGTHHSVLARIETGVIEQPNPEHLQRIADALGVDVSKLLKFLGVTPNPPLPELRTYLRRKYGVDLAEARALAQIVTEQLRNHKAREEDTQ